MHRNPYVFVVASSLAFVGTGASHAEAQGQPRRVVADVGIGFGLRQELASNCDFVDDRLAGCAPLNLGLTAEFALHLHDHIAVFIGGTLSRATPNSAGVIRGTGTSAPFDVGTGSISLGTRLYAQPIYSTFRPFAAVTVSWQEVSGEAAVLGRAVEGSASAYGFGVSPGVDVELSDRLTYRVAGMASFWFSGGRGLGPTANIGIRTGIVLRLS